MGKNFFKRAALALAATLFALSPSVSTRVSATSGDNGETVTFESWSKTTKDKTYCDDGAAAIFTAKCSSTTLKSSTLTAPSSGKTVEIILHSGDDGYFEEGKYDDEDNTVRTKKYYYADAFDDTTRPVANASVNKAFVGWSTSSAEDAAVDVEIGVSRASDLSGGSDSVDLYAVWSNKAYVYYTIFNGVFETSDGSEYTDVLLEYDAGAYFQSLELYGAMKPISSVYTFSGWNTQPYNKGTSYTLATTVDEYWTDVYSVWEYNPDNIDSLTLDEEETITVGVSIPVYKFTAPEAGYYEFYTDGVEPYEDVGDEEQPQPFVRVQNDYDANLASEQVIDPESSPYGDVHTFYEMEAGETVYVRYGESNGGFLRFNIGVKKSEMATITFNSNRDTEKAWFLNDGGEKTATKNIDFPKGDDIRYYRQSGLATDETLTFNAWWTEDEISSEDRHSYLIIDDDMEVYADYSELAAIVLDYNGGHHPYDETRTSEVAHFRPYIDAFTTPIDPENNDPTLGFVGWSRDKDATEPDSDIVEGVTSADELAEELSGAPLYAVYGEKVLVTFEVPDEMWMMDDPSVTSFSTTSAVGHIFYGMATMTDNTRIYHEAWRDQDGNIANATSGIDGTYHIAGDTTFIPVLKYQVYIYTTEDGHIVKNCGLGICDYAMIREDYEDSTSSTFSYAPVKDKIGLPVAYEEDKYFLGYATTPDATESDIIEGETLLGDLADDIYAIYGGYDTYLKEIGTEEWAKGSDEGLKIIIDRTSAGSAIFDVFEGISLDGVISEKDSSLSEFISTDNYDAREGGLILTLHSDYLDTLAAGEHTLSVHFYDRDSLDIAFAIAEADATDENPEPSEGSESDEEESPVVPNTGVSSGASDRATNNILAPIIVGGILLMVCGAVLAWKKTSRVKSEF